MAGELDRLKAELPIPPGWSAPDVIVDRIEVAGLSVRRAGVLSRNRSGAEVTGSAAEIGDSQPLRRAWLELIERMAIVDAGAGEACADGRRRPARSNGVAVHRTWAQACRNARLELIERDCVLRSWYGQAAPEPATPPAILERLASHEWVACTLDATRTWGHGASVAVIVGFPRAADVPLARGFAAREGRDEALEAAAREAVQSLAFLWNEPIPDRAPELAPTPMFHLDHYLYPGHHAQLRWWLAGAHAGIGLPLDVPAAAQVTFVDLTPAALGPTLRVARAISNAAAPLVFGEPLAELGARIPPALWVHPIP